MNRPAICHHEEGNVMIPISVVFLHKFCQLCLQSPVHPFHHPIRLWMQRRSAGFPYTKELAHFLEQSGLKMTPLI